MTSIRNVLATLMVSAACIGGLAACGGEDTKVSDKAFVTDCTKEVADNPSTKAYASEICGCVQDALEAKDLGDSKIDSKKVEDEAVAATPQCTRDALGQS